MLLKEEKPLLIPYGDLLLFLVTLVSWAERLSQFKLLSRLCLAWLVGKIAEGYFNIESPWHWNLSRLAVLVVFLCLSWRRSHHRILAMIIPSVMLIAEDLLIVNEPGILPPEHLLFALGMFLTAWLTSESYWGMASGIAGSYLVSELFNLLALKGIFRYRDIPDPFLWNFVVASLVFSALAEKAWSYVRERKNRLAGEERGDHKPEDPVVLPAPDVENPEQG